MKEIKTENLKVGDVVLDIYSDVADIIEVIKITKEAVYFKPIGPSSYLSNSKGIIRWGLPDYSSWYLI